MAFPLTDLVLPNLERVNSSVSIALSSEKMEEVETPESDISDSEASG